MKNENRQQLRHLNRADKKANLKDTYPQQKRTTAAHVTVLWTPNIGSEGTRGGCFGWVVTMIRRGDKFFPNIPVCDWPEQQACLPSFSPIPLNFELRCLAFVSAEENLQCVLKFKLYISGPLINVQLVDNGMSFSKTVILHFLVISTDFLYEFIHA